MNQLFDKICPKVGANSLQRTWKGTSAIVSGKDIKLQDLWTSIRNHLDTLEAKHILDIGDQLDDLTKIVRSLADEREASNQYSVAGSMYQINGGTMFHNSGDQATNYQAGGSQSFVFNNRNVHVSLKKDDDGSPLQCLSSLAFPQMTARGDFGLKQQVSCDWALENSSYTKWHAQGGLLCVRGRAGTGKSTLMEAIVTDLRHRTPNTLTLSFYFNRRGQPLQYTPHGLFRSMLHQLLSQDELLLSEFCRDIGFAKRVREYGKPGTNWDWVDIDLASSFLKYCEQYANKHEKIRIMIDALDETNENSARELLRWFEKLFHKATKTIAICISCRPYPRVGSSWICMDMEQMNGAAIEAYVCSTLKHGMCAKSTIDKERVINDIVQRAEGVFQWVVLVTRRVLSLEQESVESILADIRRTPAELDDVYRQILDQLDTRDKILAFPIFRWITLAVRPMSLTELRYGTSIDPFVRLQSTEEDCKNSVHWCMHDGDFRQRASRLSLGLIHVVPDVTGKTIVHFDHESVRGFMLRNGLRILEGREGMESEDELVGRGHSVLAATCVQLLAARNVRDAELDACSDRRFQGTSMALGDAMGFLEYATMHWMIHARKAEAAGLSQKRLITLTSWPSNEVWVRWNQLFESWRQSFVAGRDLYKRTTLQHLAARYGLLSIVTELINQSSRNGILSEKLFWWRWKPDGMLSKDDNHRTPISRAAEGGHYEAVKMLLEVSKSSADYYNSWGNTPIIGASWGGHTEVVRLLLSTGKVNLYRNGPSQAWPLVIAAMNGHELVVKLLLQTGKVDVNAVVDNGWTPLLRATEYGRTGVVKILLQEAKLDINAINNEDKTALDVARESGHLAIRKLLIASGARGANGRHNV
ncbi:hypothetical protein CKM354_000605800 [Cercospora kikuchii]|uniref:Nephrocystin 3-like N-terminal domain-containing protein n=1 Tax=Cercospora kikuchii TaxID=84275 RepID=A0A9P3CEH5_9PEZI|nr:uncharacterized protein CKM354_000605800 [Cercospora kikuchii]GIZ42804.1 hypothetical protein CKM354_000605800 [Cercospora kikuchii]